MSLARAPSTVADGGVETDRPQMGNETPLPRLEESIACSPNTTLQLTTPILRDCASRYIWFLPESETASDERLMFHCQDAFYYYLDMIHDATPGEPLLEVESASESPIPRIVSPDVGIQAEKPPPSFSEFAIRLLTFATNGQLSSDDIQRALERFNEYQRSIVVCGTVLLDHSLTHVLMVSAKEDSWWVFPKGKIAACESMLACAIRETFEEIGIDVTPYIRADDPPVIDLRGGVTSATQLPTTGTPSLSSRPSSSSTSTTACPFGTLTACGGVTTSLPVALEVATPWMIQRCVEQRVAYDRSNPPGFKRSANVGPSCLSPITTSGAGGVNSSVFPSKVSASNPGATPVPLTPGYAPSVFFGGVLPFTVHHKFEPNCNGEIHSVQWIPLIDIKAEYAQTRPVRTQPAQAAPTIISPHSGGKSPSSPVSTTGRAQMPLSTLAWVARYYPQLEHFVMQKRTPKTGNREGRTSPYRAAAERYHAKMTKRNNTEVPTATGGASCERKAVVGNNG